MKLKEMGSRSNYCLDQKEINNVERGRNNILSFGKDHESVRGWEQLQAFLLLRQIFERDTPPPHCWMKKKEDPLRERP